MPPVEPLESNMSAMVGPGSAVHTMDLLPRILVRVAFLRHIFPLMIAPPTGFRAVLQEGVGRGWLHLPLEG
jgi:hypothetical protein